MCSLRGPYGLGSLLPRSLPPPPGFPTAFPSSPSEPFYLVSVPIGSYRIWGAGRMYMSQQQKEGKRSKVWPGEHLLCVGQGAQCSVGISSLASRTSPTRFKSSHVLAG